MRLERAWAKDPSGTDKDLNAIAGADGAMWIVGDDGTALRFEGGAWKSEPTATKKRLRDVWLESKDSAWAVGDEGTVLHWDGNAWKAQASGTKNDLHAVTGFGKDGVVAVGKKGVVILYDGKTWKTAPNRTDAELLAVMARSATEVVAAGERGTVVRTIVTTGGGRDWTAETVKEAGNLRGVWIEPGKDVYDVCDETGNVFRRVFSRWEREVRSQAGEVRAVTTIGSAIWAAGDRGRVLVRAAPAWLGDVAPQIDVRDVWGKDEGEIIAVGKGGAIVRRKRR